MGKLTEFSPAGIRESTPYFSCSQFGQCYSKALTQILYRFIVHHRFGIMCSLLDSLPLQGQP
jgi:hypothetical protein